ncbi:hypothetical protein RBH94_10210 [Aestuariibaculum sp. YM273]|uniref:hypothetical protein n=1 Tax=Aestuariibaculum sp. YM273 TaxID=3070659 RepID=UPI0027DCE086|nr:hypothetical protein [Aestuariibaculum sp. YM273]WMI64433.1 hypothetical protein RBH94_10210 [Aestuariibaculum sp. YM273]
MKRILLIIALFIIAKLSGAQEVIWNTSNYQKGIYKTYAEFITNKPSLDYDAFEIQDKKASCGLTSFKTLDVKRFKIKNKEAKKIEGIVGFSDGTHVYINPAALNGLISKTNFYTVEFYQQFAFIEFIKTTTIRNGSYTSNSNDAAKGVFNLNNEKFLN